MYTYEFIYLYPHSPAGNMLPVLYVKASMDVPWGASSAPCEGQLFDLPSPRNHGEYMENGLRNGFTFMLMRKLLWTSGLFWGFPNMIPVVEQSRGSESSSKHPHYCMITIGQSEVPCVDPHLLKWPMIQESLVVSWGLWLWDTSLCQSKLARILLPYLFQ